jgi:low affinity Fe/Cu permease
VTAGRRAGYQGAVSIKHPAEERRGAFDRLAEAGSNFTSSPAFFVLCVAIVLAWIATWWVGEFAQHVVADLMAAVTLLLLALLKNAERRAEGAIQQKLDAIAAALLEQQRGDRTGAQDELAEAIGLHDEV